MTEIKGPFKTSNTAQYQIDGWHIVDIQHPERRVYIRALIEVGCSEFAHCQIPAYERLAIIEAIGQDRIFELMHEVFSAKGRKYNAEIDGIYDVRVLREMAVLEAASGDGAGNN